jgi:hypothetical protein
MYANPAKIRKHIVKLCLNDDEALFLESLVNMSGEQRQVVARQLFSVGMDQMEKQNNESDSKAA